MPRAKVRFSPDAQRWFRKHILEIAEVNPEAARKIVARVENLTQLLSSFPEMTERGLLPGTRKIHIKPFILTARINRGVVEIAAIRHARQKDANAPSELADDFSNY